MQVTSASSPATQTLTLASPATPDPAKAVKKAMGGEAANTAQLTKMLGHGSGVDLTA